MRKLRADTSRVAMPHLAELDMDLATRLLIVDDDPDIRDLTASFLAGHGYLVDTAQDATAMRARLAHQRYALVILDIMMPGEDGLAILRSLDRTTAPPIIIVSVFGEEVDRIVGLEMGADDYVAKPASPRELLARVRSVLRRQGDGGAEEQAAAGREHVRFAGWRLDAAARELVDPDEVMINLSDGEFRLLMTFVEHPRRVLTRDFLLDHSRGANADHFDRAIDVQVSRLRRKLARGRRGGDDLIRTVRNEGYMFTADATRR